MSLKKIALIVFVPGLVAFFIFLFNAENSQKADSNSLNPAYGEYISSYTTGVISSGSSL